MIGASLFCSSLVLLLQFFSAVNLIGFQKTPNSVSISIAAMHFKLSSLVVLVRDSIGVALHRQNGFLEVRN